MNNDGIALQNLNGSIAVVTGAAQGLGLGIVEQLARDGATTIIADLQLEKAEAEANRLHADGLKACAAHLDITNSTEVTAFFNRVVSEHGRLDILVNNAGTGQKVTPIVELSDAEWDRVLNVTLTGAFYCCRAAGGIMEDQEQGCIVNVASINGQNPAAPGCSVQRSKGRYNQPDQNIGYRIGSLWNPSKCRESRSGLYRI